MTSLLDIRGLNIRFPDSHPVRNLDLRVEAGEAVALVGESGSGKSLTALAIMRLLRADARIEARSMQFDGLDLATLPDRGMRDLRGARIGMVFQDPMSSLNPTMTIGRQIGEPLRLHRGLSRAEARRRAIELLDRVGIARPGERVDDYPHRFSGGMRQRVMIAMAIACHPALIVADEPTTALDPETESQIMGLLDGLRRELGIGLLLITHNMKAARAHSDRVAVLYAGHGVEEGPTSDVMERPIHPYTRNLLKTMPGQRDTAHYSLGPLAEIKGSIASAAGEAGCPFAPRCALVQRSCTLAPPAPRPLRHAPQHWVACPVVAA